MQSDLVNSPAHYTEGRRFEVIDVLEDWASRASDPVEASLLFSACKYLGRLYDKGDSPLLNAKKAQWYLNRLIDKLNAKDVPFDSSNHLSGTHYDDVLQAATDPTIANVFSFTEPWK